MRLPPSPRERYRDEAPLCERAALTVVNEPPSQRGNA